MNTTEQVIETGRRRRRSHSAHFKAEAVGACQQPGISIAAVALARGLNAAMLHRWVKAGRAQREAHCDTNPASSVAIESARSFVPVPLPSNPADGRDPNRGAAPRRHGERRVAGIGSA